MSPALLLLALSYPWLGDRVVAETVAQRFSPPDGFVADTVARGSFAEWLRGLPLKPGRPPVLLFDRSEKVNQSAHAAVVDMDVGSRDLQQCADAVMRLRAEYLFAASREDEIAFHLTSGDLIPFSRFARGGRLVVNGSRVRWTVGAPTDTSYASLRRYLDIVFTYAGSRSLAAELVATNPAQPDGGDVFIVGGSPGHAVLVVHTATDAGGRRGFVLAQSYMPAQEVHVLVNPATGGVWYSADDAPLVTPEWTFPRHSLRRFPEIARH